MNAKKFLVRELNALVTQLSGVRLRYKYDELTTTHVVEVAPKSVYNSDKFIALSFDVYEKFDSHFPNEGFVFIPDDNYVGIDDIVAEEITLQASAATKPKARKRAPLAAAL
jgi:hypothetical protein